MENIHFACLIISEQNNNVSCCQCRRPLGAVYTCDSAYESAYDSVYHLLLKVFSKCILGYISFSIFHYYTRVKNTWARSNPSHQYKTLHKRCTLLWEAADAPPSWCGGAAVAALPASDGTSWLNRLDSGLCNGLLLFLSQLAGCKTFLHIT
jgi:hypothetical protein